MGKARCLVAVALACSLVLLCGGVAPSATSWSLACGDGRVDTILDDLDSPWSISTPDPSFPVPTLRFVPGCHGTAMAVDYDLRQPVLSGPNAGQSWVVVGKALSSTTDLSGYTHIRLAIQSLTPNTHETVEVKLRDQGGHLFSVSLKSLADLPVWRPIYVDFRELTGSGTLDLAHITNLEIGITRCNDCEVFDNPGAAHPPDEHTGTLLLDEFAVVDLKPGGTHRLTETAFEAVTPRMTVLANAANGLLARLVPVGVGAWIPAWFEELSPNFNSYVQAEALLVFIYEYERTGNVAFRDAARALATRLLGLQVPATQLQSGAWHTAYNSAGASPGCSGNETIEQDIDRCEWVGNTGWVLIALARLQRSGFYTDATALNAAVTRGADWIVRQQQERARPEFPGLISLGIEGNISACFGLMAAGRAAEATVLRNAIFQFGWDPIQRRMKPGVGPNDVPTAIDVSGSWGPTLLRSMGRRQEALDSQAFSASVMRINSFDNSMSAYGDIAGPYTPAVEFTGQVAAAGIQGADFVIEQMLPLQAPDGVFPGALDHWYGGALTPWVTTMTGVSPTAWVYFALSVDPLLDLVAPAVTLQPADRTVKPGQTATFTAAATGTPAPTVQWQGRAGSGSMFGNIGGATATTYAFTAAVSDNGKQFRAVFANSVDSAISSAATLTVLVPPVALTATPAGFAQIRLTWTAVAGATSYNVKRGMTSGGETPLATGVTTASYSDVTVARGLPYFYVVSAVHDGVESDNSNEAGAKTPTRLAPLDFDGDGKGDLTYVRPSTFDWHTRQTHAGYTTSTSAQWGLPGDRPVPGDYDGDGIVDPAVYRPSNGTWFLTASTLNGSFLFAVAMGLSTDVPVPADYDGDGRTDPAVYRPSTGTWYVLKSSTGLTIPLQWGLPDDVPVASDYDGDGQADPAVYRPSSGTWFVLQSSTDLTTSVTFALGVRTDRPVPGDYDGDGKADPAVYRPSINTWLRLQSSAGYAPAPPVAWGLAADLPVPADYDGDGRIDVAVYRPSSGTWYVLFSGTPLGLALTWGQADDVPLPIVSAPRAHPDTRRLSDVDGDGRADLTVFRPASGEWFSAMSSANYEGSAITQWGLPTDTPAPGDYDGDGKADRAVFRPATGLWYVLTSSSGNTGFFTVQWGLSTDVPVPGDYDGDGATDLAVYRPPTGQWFILTSSSGYTTSLVIQWGLPTDTPVANDYDGDGKTDPAVFRPSSGTWYVLTSRSNYTAFTATGWGLTTDIAVPGDYDADGKGDMAVFRPPTGQWFLLFSGANFTTSHVVQWGLPSDVVVPLDYDGDHKTDPAVYRPATGTWYVLMSSSGFTSSFTRQWGLATDVPILKRH